MERKWLAIGIILLFVVTFVIPATAQKTENSQSASRGNWLYVGGSGPGNYTKIQDAINDASNGDTVFVFNGVYIVKEFTLSKSISLIGEDKYSTIIDGNGSNYIMEFAADYITLCCFTLQNVEYGGFTCLIKIMSSSKNNIIANNIFNDSSWYAIRMLFTGYNTIIDNIVMNCGWHTGSEYGIHCIDVTGDIIRNNTLIGGGIYLESASDLFIISNHVIDNQINLYHGNNVIFKKNIIDNDSNIKIERSIGCSLDDNLLINSGAIILRESTNIRIYNNTFNDSYGILITGASIDFWETHTIENNKINGKPIYYFKDEQHITVPKNASQVIFVSCNNCKIDNISFIKNCGIQLGFSSNNIINNTNILESIDSGIKLQDSSKNNISNNNINGTKNYGIESLGLSGDNIFYNNTIVNNYNDGISISADAPNNSLYKNFIQYNHGDGIQLNSNFNNVLNNLIIGNDDCGIFCSGLNNSIGGNHVERNDVGLLLYKGIRTIISQNNFINNSKSVSFYIDYKNKTSNKWIKNYYDDFNFFVKIISGTVETRFGYWVFIPDDGYEWYWIRRKGINVDWHPAQESYDIGR